MGMGCGEEVGGWTEGRKTRSSPGICWVPWEQGQGVTGGQTRGPETTCFAGLCFFGRLSWQVPMEFLLELEFGIKGWVLGKKFREEELCDPLERVGDETGGLDVEREQRETEICNMTACFSGWSEMFCTFRWTSLLPPWCSSCLPFVCLMLLEMGLFSCCFFWLFTGIM